MPQENQATDSPLQSSNSSEHLGLEHIKDCALGNAAIFTGACVDPDGLASGMAMKRIIEHIGGDGQIFFRGSFNRPQNKTMREVLGIDVRNIDDYSPELFTTNISVDGPIEVCPTSNVEVVIDHHKPGATASRWSDVRATGSASAIMWKYLKTAGIDLTDEGDDIIATALAIGISTDTNNFEDESATSLDFEAYSDCLGKKNHKLFLSILNYPKPPYYNDMFAAGWENKDWVGTVLVTGLGDLPEGRSGVISDLAEGYNRTHGINTSLVAALVGNELWASMRSSNTALDVNDFMSQHGGGGKRGAGATRIPLPLLDGATPENRESVYHAYLSILSDRCMQYAGDES